MISLDFFFFFPMKFVTVILTFLTIHTNNKFILSSCGFFRGGGSQAAKSNN